MFLEYEKEKAIREHGAIKNVAQTFGIKYQTLRSHIQAWKRSTNLINKEKRGGWNKWITVDEERDLYLYIKGVFIDGGLPFNNYDLKLLAIEKINALHPHCLRSGIGQFMASEGWVSGFNKRWRLTSVRPKPVVVDPIEEKHFVEECKREHARVGPVLF